MAPIAGLAEPAAREFEPTRVASRRAVPALAAFVVLRVFGLAVLGAFAAASDRNVHRVLTSWDSQWYAGIARNGYGFVRLHEDGRLLSDYVFFPLYPVLERLVAEGAGLRHVDAGLLISWLASVFAAWGIFAVGDHLYGRPVGVLACVLWASLPVGVVASTAYSESLFTALAAWALYGVLTRRWVWAGVLACLSGLTRPVGVAVIAAVIIPAALMWFHGRHVYADPPLRRRWICIRPLVGAIIAPLGWLGYIGWVGLQTGTPTGYFDAAGRWGNGFDGGVAFASWVGELLASPDSRLGVLVCLGVAVLAWLCILCIRQGQPLPLLIFCGVLVFLALTTSGYFGSKPRYLLPAFPLLLPVAAWLARRRTAVQASVVALMASASAIYGAVWLLGPGPP